jgi:hypothetical protein
MSRMNRTLTMCAGLALVLVLATAGTLPAAEGALDGKTFSVSVWEPGNDEPSDDTLVFTDGTFRSQACDEYGFEATPYETGEGDEGITFTADAMSAEEGTNHWQGVVDADRVEGTFTWTKPGQDAIEYRFEGELAE